MAKITVFTPTYNRAYILSNLYKSLQRQSANDFEWIIVDDESTDETEQLVNSWIENDKNEFSILYHKQSHGGKHRAINYAVQISNAEYFFTVDSDDYLTEYAIEKILEWIEETKGIETIGGIAGIKSLSNGKLGGEPRVNKKGFVDAGNYERKKYKLSGDKAEIYKTELLKKFKFPEFENEYFVTEAVVANQIARAGYKLRWYNDTIYMCEYLQDGLTRTGANDILGFIENYQGFTFYVKNEIAYNGIFKNKEIVENFLKASKAKDKTVAETVKAIDINYLQYIYTLVLFKIWYVYKLLKRKIAK